VLLSRVAVPVPLGQAFTYAVPPELEGSVVRGSRVLCEFGKRRILGVVLKVGDDGADVPLDKIKPIAAVVDPEPVFSEELLDFLWELARYYIAPIGEVMRLALPAVERSAADALDRRGLLGSTKLETVGRLIQIAEAKQGVVPAKLSSSACELYEHLRKHGPEPVAELGKRWKSARALVRRLKELGLVELLQRQASVDPFFSSSVARDTPPELNPEQACAVERIIGCLEAGKAGQFLLDGVTASGKTEVYLRAVERCLALGRGAIVLVPEIALTPQLVARFRARIGNTIAVLHSGLSERDRHAMWKALRSGELSVAVGARSALFAPIERLALICVDEEHDSSFKQEEGVRYNARDMALLRAHRAGAVAVLGSATPSLGSQWLAGAGRLERLKLPARAHRAAVLPNVEIVDLRRIGAGPTGDNLLSLPLYRALERVLGAKEQAILFLNRRGFSPSLLCGSCGSIANCPNCAVALTLHRSGGERLVCHYCDYTTSEPRPCETCKARHFLQEGAGTERVEAILHKAFPEARLSRLDRDTASGIKSEKVLDKVRSGEVDILVGTQMVTKGHDLPNVTLVGVLNADAALAMPDFNAAERCFHLLVQVAGRAGRGGTPGTVIIQTRQPEHPAIALAAAHDVGRFVELELEARRELGYPPFSRIALVRLDSIDEARVRTEAQRIAAFARKSSSGGVDILGPAPAPIARLRNRWRYRFMVRARERALLRQVLLAVARTKCDPKVHLAIDVDPVNML
jgi:primosomal protein N' (replication factor Y)